MWIAGQHAQAGIYKIRARCNVKEAVSLIKGSSGDFGLVVNETGINGTCEVRIYNPLRYTTGGREDNSLIYGAYTNFTTTNEARSFDIETKPWYCAWAFCTDTHVSTDYKDRLLQTLNDEWKSEWTTNFDNIKELDVIIELETTGSAVPCNIFEINLPGVAHLSANQFLEENINALDEYDIAIRGINFALIKPVKATDADKSCDRIISEFDIQNTYNDLKNVSYQMAIPFKADASLTDADKPYRTGTGQYATNIAVYPRYGGLYYGHHYGVACTTSKMSSLKDANYFGGATIEEGGRIFKKDNKVYHLYWIYPGSGDRVLLRNIGEEGPFPVANGRLIVKEPTSNDHNKKIIDKTSVSPSKQFLVAWHRGFWRDAPENSLQSIKAAAGYDMIELDVSRAGGGRTATGQWHSSDVPHYMLFHDPFMFRSSSIGPTDACIHPYEKLLIPWRLTQRSNKTELLDTLKQRFPGYADTVLEDWLKEPKNLKYTDLLSIKLRDRFGCLTDVAMPTWEQAIEEAKTHNLPIMVDKGESEIDGIYWLAIEHNYDDMVFFKGSQNATVAKLANSYHHTLMQQIIYTPFIDDKAFDQKNGNDLLGAFLHAESGQRWHVPGFEMQVKRTAEDCDGESLDVCFPQATRDMLAFILRNKRSKWMGITHINPTAINGFDNKVIIMDADNLADLADYGYLASRYDRRADLDFDYNYLQCDYFTADRPDVVLAFLKALGKL